MVAITLVPIYVQEHVKPVVWTLVKMVAGIPVIIVVLKLAKVVQFNGRKTLWKTKKYKIEESSLNDLHKKTCL